MELSNQKSTETLINETWAVLKEIAESQKKFDKRFEKSSEEFNKRMEDFDLGMKKSREEFDLSMKKSREEFDLGMKKSREEFDLSMKKSGEEFDRRMKEINKNLGSWSNNFGSFAEEYFMNSFEQGEKKFFGEHFDEIEKNMRYRKSKGEYDIVLINEKCIGIIEVKFRGHLEDIKKFLEKPNSFREDFPDYKEHKIYLGLASMSFYPELERECKNEGIAIIKQDGGNVIIIDEHLKAF